ncbi:MAG TPA: TonB-dependent receptor [Pyrinomonadaceae bacterium]|jgi:outer membrane receptor protein involved in Fe transport
MLYVFHFFRLKTFLAPRLFILLLFLFPFLSSPTFAQIVSGTIADEQNAPIQNARVSLSAGNQKIAETLTDSSGAFSLGGGNLPDLILRVSADRFAPFEKRLADVPIPAVIILQPQNLQADVTVSIAQTETRRSETPASVVVLSRETLENTAAQTVDDQLRQIAGFQLFRRSSSKTSNPTTQGANFRGLSGSGASRASVALDGVSVNDAFGGWTYWSRIPKTAVEQIETLRGGASSLYGDAALSGAINLQTKSFAEKPIFRFETSAGTQKTFEGSAFGALGWRGWNFSGSLDAFHTNGYIPIDEAERGAVDANANSRYQNVFLTVEKKFGETNSTRRREDAAIFENARIFLRGNYFVEKRDNGTRLTDNQTRFRQIVFGADFGNENFGFLQFRTSIEKQIYDQTFSAISNNRNTETLSRIQRAPSQAASAGLFWARVFSVHAISASSEFRDVRGTSNETIFVNSRASSIVGAGGREQTFSISAQDFWRVSRKLNLSFGARFDAWNNQNALSATKNLATNQTTTINFPDRRETAFSPRVAALYQLNRNFGIYGSFSKSFRAPTLNELYRAFRVGNVLTLANENLQAERAHNYETGANFTGFSRRVNLRGNFFVAEVSRPIFNITLSSTANLITRQRQNAGATRSRGLELDAEYAPRRDLRFSGSYLLVDSRVTDFPANAELIGKRLPQIAGQQLNYQIFYRPPSGFSVSAQARISGAQFEDDANILRLRPFFTLDALAARRFDKFEIFAAIENIFNNRYDIGLTPNRTVAAPRFARVGLRFDLGR